MQLPESLVEQVRQGRAALFLGAGASIGAMHPQSRRMLTGQGLADELARKFLGQAYVGGALAHVAEVAISETDLRTVQGFVSTLFEPFQPAEFHQKLPSFRWSGIATTNYDLIIERAYSPSAGRQQRLVPFLKDGQPVEDTLRATQDALVYLKLHGCISKIDDEAIPLILTPDQYVTHRENRRRLFDRFFNLAFEFPIVYVGYGLADLDIRRVILEISKQGLSTPRSYLVTPSIQDPDRRYYEQKKITCLQGTFAEFMAALDLAIPEPHRRLSIISGGNSDSAVARHLRLPPNAPIPSHLQDYLDNNLEYVHSGLQCEAANPRQFYQGYLQGWASIQQNLDIRRKVYDDIMGRVIVDAAESGPELSVIKGHAGAGKSVALRRIAWDAATSLGSELLCLFVRPEGKLIFSFIRELYHLARKRLFIFVEPASRHRHQIDECIRNARTERLPVSIVTSERHNEWNETCGVLDGLVSYTEELRYLAESEVLDLLSLLERHRSLGHLQTLSQTERMHALSHRAGRQLLVALHEATLGKPFSDIVFDEYDSISNQSARSLYLTICVLHQLNVEVRAGLVNRVHAIPLSDFRSQFSAPLEGIVFTRQSKLSQDYYYCSRHPHIAELVVERALKEPGDRFSEYYKILSHLDPDYQSDRAALRALSQARHLNDHCLEPSMARELLELARERDHTSHIPVQQRAIYEMVSPEGDLDVAERLLVQAEASAPRDLAIKHSRAELALRRASRAQSRVERLHFRKKCREIANEILRTHDDQVHPFHTLLKLCLDELEEVISEHRMQQRSGQGQRILAQADDSVREKVAEFEKTLSNGQRKFPYDERLLEIEASFAEKLGEYPRSLEALNRAFRNDASSPFIALRLAKVYVARGESEKALACLRSCYDLNPNNKDIPYCIAKLLEKESPENLGDIKYYLRRSFTKGDRHHEAQFRFARVLCLDGEWGEAKSFFDSLRDARVSSDERYRYRGRVPNRRFSGIVLNHGGAYVTIEQDRTGALVFADRSGAPDQVWQALRKRSRVTFAMAFNYLGPVAIELKLE